jgi:hypothetical protein
MYAKGKVELHPRTGCVQSAHPPAHADALSPGATRASGLRRAVPAGRGAPVHVVAHRFPRHLTRIAPRVHTPRPHHARRTAPSRHRRGLCRTLPKSSPNARTSLSSSSHSTTSTSPSPAAPAAATETAHRRAPAHSLSHSLPMVRCPCAIPVCTSCPLRCTRASCSQASWVIAAATGTKPKSNSGWGAGRVCARAGVARGPGVRGSYRHAAACSWSLRAMMTLIPRRRMNGIST